MEMLGHYKLSGTLTNENAGYSMWGFGERDGVQYFIKQFLTPKFPVNDTESSPERIVKKIQECDRFAETKKALYSVLNASSDGNNVRVREFFRLGSRFYIAMDKVDALPWTVETIARLSDDETRRLCAIISHAISSLHQGGIVHADIKHENILYTRLNNGSVTAKVIDFDNSFLAAVPPKDGEEVVGDFNYFAPEACARIYGERAVLGCKIDVFALGILFHQYFSGQLPKFEGDGYSCPGDAVLKGYSVILSDAIPADVANLIRSMLKKAPEERPSAQEVFCRLRQLPFDLNATEKEIKEAVTPPPPGGTNPFYRAGDLT